jgi:predicted secreted protein
MPTSTPTAGSAGIFKVATVAMVQVQTVDLTINGATYDVTVMTGMSTPAFKLFIAGLRDWTLKVVGLYDFANDAVQATLWAAFLAGTIEAVSFSPNTGTNAFTGNALITSLPQKFDVKAVSTAEFDFQGTGPLAYA